MGAEINAAISAWAAAWESCSATQILALWDKTDLQSWYLTSDSVEAYTGSEIVGVLQRRCIGLRAALYKPENIHVRQLSADVASVFFELNWMRIYDGKAPVGGRVRVTMVMREIEKIWRLFHYAEAPLAPLLELQAFYERVAAQGLDAIPRREYE